MKRKFNLFVLPAILVAVFLASGCAKYEDGPSLTILPKKARLTGVWELDKYSGVGVSSGLTIEFKKDGTFIRKVAGISTEGTWEFDGEKEKVVIKIGLAREEAVITRLTNKELWFKDVLNKVSEYKKK